MPDPNSVALPDYGVVFMLLPKVANTSIKIALLKALGQPTHTKVHQPGLFEYVTRDQAKRFEHRIAFVRDPLARLASCYQDKIVELTDGRFIGDLDRFGLRPGMPFLEFIERIAETPDKDCTGVGQHFRSMSFDLCDGDRAIPNVIGRFERLAEDWDQIGIYLREQVGLEVPPLTHERATAGRATYCKRGRAFALQRYRDDIRLFGYRRPYQYEIDADAEVQVGRSICNVIRETYQIARDRVEDPAVSQRLQDLLAEAFDMGKRMNAKLPSSQYED